MWVKKLKRRPKRVDLIIPPGATFTFDDLPNGTFYVKRPDGYWKITHKLVV